MVLFQIQKWRIFSLLHTISTRMPTRHFPSLYCTLPPTHWYTDTHELCNLVCRSFEGLDELEASLDKFSIPLTSSLVSQVIDSCKNKAPTRRLLRFVLWSHKNLDDKLEDADYNHAIRVFAESKDFRAMEILISDLGREGRRMETYTFSVVADALVKLGREEGALGIFKNLDKFNCPQDRDTVTGIVSALCSKGHAKKAEGVVSHHKDKISGSELLVYRSLLYGWSEKKNVKEARKIIKEMKSLGVPPDLFCYNTFLRCLCERNLKSNPSGLVPEALNVMMEMRSYQITPTSISYNIVLSCLGRTRRVKESLRILDIMIGSGCSPDWVSYHLVARVLYLTGRFGKGNHTVDKMIQAGLVPERKFYYDLIGVLCGVERVNYALELFEKMKKSFLGGYGPVYDLLVPKLCSGGEFVKGRELWEEATTMGITIQCSRDMLDPSITEVFKPVRKVKEEINLIDHMPRSKPDVAKTIRKNVKHKKNKKTKKNLKPRRHRSEEETNAISIDSGEENPCNPCLTGGDGGGRGGKNGDAFIDRSKVRILLCDNNPKSSEEVFTLLCKCSYQVRSARQVIDALNAEGRDIDIILSEVDLPMAKGLKMLKYIMRDKKLQRVPVIMMSAQDEVSIVVKCLRLGAADYLVKPLRTNELLILWTHMWRRRRMLGLADKNMLNYDFDAVPSDPSDANTNSTTLFSDDTDERSRKSTNPDIWVATRQEDEVNVIQSQVMCNAAAAAAPLESPPKVSLDNRPDVRGISDHRTGQFASCPKKNKLRIGESSAFFTYVKLSIPKSNAQEVAPDIENTTLDSRINDSKLNPWVGQGGNDTQRCESREVHETQSQGDDFPSSSSIPDSLSMERSSTPPVVAEFRQQRDAKMEVFSQVRMHPDYESHLRDVSGFHPHPAYPYFVPGVMNQVMMAPAHIYQNNLQDLPNHATIGMLPQYGHMPQCPPHMASFPYYPFGVCMQPGQMPTTHLWQPSYGSSSAAEGKVGKVDRREAALRKFRQKWKERCFDKKIWYVNRKRLAEKWPRVRGQFVRKKNGINVDLNGQPTSGDFDDEDEEEDEEEPEDDASIC